MKTYRVIATDTATWHGKAEEYQLRWQAEQAYEKARAPGKLVTLAEFVDGRQIEIVKDSRWETKEKQG